MCKLRRRLTAACRAGRQVPVEGRLRKAGEGCAVGQSGSDAPQGVVDDRGVLLLAEDALMHIIHSAHVDGPRSARQPHAWLQVSRGGTRFPLRPICTARFLIGAGTNCHLQLGGDIPLLHSLLLREFDGWTIEAIAPEPVLLVNGSDTRRCRLEPDDVVTIGPFELCLVLPVPTRGDDFARIPARMAG